MTINYTTLLGLAQPVTGTETGQWGDIVNNQITSLLEDSIAKSVTLNVTAANVTLTSNEGVANQARVATLIITGTPGTNRNIIAPSQSKIYQVINQSDSSVVIKGAATTGVTILAGASGVVAWNGSDFIEIGAIASNRTVSGNFTVNGNTTLGDNVDDVTTVSGNFTVNGNTTLGDNAADVTTVSGNFTVNGTALIAAGTATTPSLTTTGDTNTGVYFPAADTVGVAVGGVNVGNFTSAGFSGNLVNGNATLAAGTAAAPSLTTTGDANTGVYFPAADTVAIATGGVKRVEVDANGNVGVATTPSAWGGVYKGFQIGQGGLMSRTGGSDVYLLGNNYYDGTNFRYINNSFASQYAQNLGTHAWYTAPSGTAGNPITFTQAMTLDASGNLGLGTTSPFTVAGYIAMTINGTSGSISSYYTSGSETGRVQSYSEGVNTGVLALESMGSAGSLRLRTNGAERARITSDGNLLVGTTSNMTWTIGASSANKLQLGGSRPIALNTDDGSINYKANTGGWAMGSSFYGSSGTYRGGFGVYGSADNLSYYWVGTAFNGTGALLTYGNTSWSALSDEREKTVHGNIENAVEKIKNIRAVYFNYNTDEPSVRRRAGFIAQDFQNVFPEIVQEIDRSDADATEEIKRLVMSYSETTPLLLAAIKEQQALIEAQKTAIESLTARITALEAK